MYIYWLTKSITYQIENIGQYGDLFYSEILLKMALLISVLASVMKLKCKNQLLEYRFLFIFLVITTIITTHEMANDGDPPGAISLVSFVWIKRLLLRIKICKAPSKEETEKQYVTIYIIIPVSDMVM